MLTRVTMAQQRGMDRAAGPDVTAHHVALTDEFCAQCPLSLEEILSQAGFDLALPWSGRHDPTLGRHIFTQRRETSS